MPSGHHFVKAGKWASAILQLLIFIRRLTKPAAHEPPYRKRPLPGIGRGLLEYRVRKKTYSASSPSTFTGPLSLPFSDTSRSTSSITPIGAASLPRKPALITRL